MCVLSVGCIWIALRVALAGMPNAPAWSHHRVLLCIWSTAIQVSHLILAFLAFQGIGKLAEASHPGIPVLGLVCSLMQQLSCILHQTPWHVPLGLQIWYPFRLLLSREPAQGIPTAQRHRCTLLRVPDADV